MSLISIPTAGDILLYQPVAPSFTQLASGKVVVVVTGVPTGNHEISPSLLLRRTNSFRTPSNIFASALLMLPTIQSLKAELAAAQDELHFLRRHHAACRTGYKDSSGTTGERSGGFMEWTREEPAIANPELANANSLFGGKRRKRSASHGSAQVRESKKQKGPETAVIASIIQEIDQSPANHANGQPLLLSPVTSLNAKQRASEIASTLQNNKANQRVEHRIGLFYFFSCIVALQQTKILSKEDLEEDICTALLKKSEYVKRAMKGVRWMHTNIIRGLLDQGWTLEKSTAVVARCEYITNSSGNETSAYYNKRCT